LREFGLISTNILAEPDVMLLEEIMIVQCGTVLETVLSSTHDAIRQLGGIWIFPNCQHCSTIIIKSEHVIGSVVSIRDVDLHQIEARFIAVRKWLRSIFIGTIGGALIVVVALFGIGSTTGSTTSSPTARTTGGWRVWARGANSIHSSTSSCPKRWDARCSCTSGSLSRRS